MPRQTPRYGIPCSRAIRAAAILPSMPRTPKPPGIRMPAASAMRGRAPPSPGAALPPLAAAPADAARDQDAVGLLDAMAALLVPERLRVDPVDLDAAAVL